MKTRVLMSILVLLLALAPAKAQEKPQQKKNNDTSGNGSPVKPVIEEQGYVIGATDAITVSVWKEPELTLSLVVRPDGMISIPLLGDVKAAGMTPMQLSMALAEKLRKYVNEPQVTIIVNSINSRIVYLVGEVNRAGTYPMLPNMTVLMALSGAGGFSQFANTKKIYVLRFEDGVQKKFPFNYNEVIKGKRPEENIMLKPGDTIVVP
ncbi:MAG: polysaccharide export protein [Acidobacteriales bacterium]|nr:polysaccharide export protein [Terriglobales bacterium]